MPALGLGLGIPFQRGAGARSALSVLIQLGLTTGAKLVLDAGDSASYLTGQSWLDRSGNGYDFFRGADNTSSATDPTFNGVAGALSSSEYWSFDGGDYFTYDTTNETWMQNLHKDNAVYTFLLWVQVATVANAGFFSTSTGALSDIGFSFATTSGNTLTIIVGNGAGAGKNINMGSNALSTGAWHCVGISLNEATGANGVIWFVDGTTVLANSTYTSPSASAASHTAHIGARGNNSIALPNGGKMAMLMAWEGVALTDAQMQAVFSATRGRFSV